MYFVQMSPDARMDQYACGSGHTVNLFRVFDHQGFLQKSIAFVLPHKETNLEFVMAMATWLSGRHQMQ
jgi:hypothetical protein